MLPGKKYTPEEVLQIVWHRKWLILVPFVVASVCTALVAQRLPKRYRSETVILVVPQRVPESYVRSTVTTRIEDRLSSIREQILSRSRARTDHPGFRSVSRSCAARRSWRTWSRGCARTST